MLVIREPSDAIATDGAAPNKPENVGGANSVPIAANAETTSPPSRNRAARSIAIEARSARASR